MATAKTSSVTPSTTRATKTTKTTDDKKLQKQIADLTAKCNALEKRCASLESTVKNNSKNVAGSGANVDHEERWQQLRNFLIDRFGIEHVKRSKLFW